MLKKVLLTLMIVMALLIAGLAAAAYWAYNQQSAVLIRSANQVLAAYGIEVTAIDGLQTGLQQSRAESVEFVIEGHTAVQRIHSLTLDYELQSLIQGQFSQLSVQSAALQLQHPALPEDALIVITDIVISCQATTICSGSAAPDISVTRLSTTSPTIDAYDIAASARINFDYNAPGLRVTIEPGFGLTLEQASIHSEDSALVTAEQLSLLSNQTWRFNLDTETQMLVFDGGQLLLKAPALRNQPDTDNAGLSGFEADISRFNGSYDFSGQDSAAPWMSRLSTQIRLELAHIYTTLQPFNLWSYRWPVDVQWDSTQGLGINISAVNRGSRLARLQLDQNFIDGRGSFQFDTESLVFSPSGDSLSTLVSPLPLDADLINGEIDVAADISWQIPGTGNASGNASGTSADISANRPANIGANSWRPAGNIRIEATELAGVIDETIFTGLTTSAQFQLQNDLSLVSSATTRLRIQTIDPGLPLSNIQTRFRLNSATGLLELLSLDFEMFGGAVQSDAFSINLNQTEAMQDVGDSFQLRLDGVDISEVLGLSAYNGVSATGLVNGTLPIRLKGLKPIIEGGHLNARVPGGSIRYNSGDTATGNQSLDLVYQALEHYRYDTLAANVDYNEAGELTLEMQLQGESPQLNNGQRINLNLNISDNIPALLQSLQAAQGITDRLEELLE